MSNPNEKDHVSRDYALVKFVECDTCSLHFEATGICFHVHITLYMKHVFQIKRYLNVTNEDNIPWALIRSALSSVAYISMVPMQDILCLGSGSRMNTPATQVFTHHSLFTK